MEKQAKRSIRLRDWEVRAVLDGRKTQSRLIVKQLLGFPKHGLDKVGACVDGTVYCASQIEVDDDQVFTIQCPLGTVGDRLWVREAWTPDHAAFYPNFPIVYRADFGCEYERNERGEVY